jgi:NAD(P)-dependent dehydrogenase (short-subunit alcohol dehydrogenase family)
VSGRPDRVALVTAASRGIGAACARTLAARGYRVSLLARSDAVHALAAELSGIAVAGSVEVAEDLAAAVEHTLSRYGRIDAVVNNTGHPQKGDLLSVDDASWQQGFSLILQSVIRMARLVTPVLQRQGGGAIVNVSSLWAVEPHLDAPVSSTLRAALSSFTKLYADRYAAEGIRMNCVLAGFVDTYPVAEKFSRLIPMRRVAGPEEVARVAAFLLSDDAGYVTGQSVRADGGLTRSF